MSYQMIGYGVEPPPAPPTQNGGGVKESPLTLPPEQLPAPCNDREKLREMMSAAFKVPIPKESEQPSEEQQKKILASMIAWTVANDISSDTTPETFCDALVCTSSGGEWDTTAKTCTGVVPSNGNGEGIAEWWEKQPTGTKVAIGAGGVAVVGLLGYGIYRALK